MTQTKAFASQADLEEKKVTFSQISEHAWAYTAEGDPNTGIVIGDDAVLVADTQATPAMAADVIPIGICLVWYIWAYLRRAAHRFFS